MTAAQRTSLSAVVLRLWLLTGVVLGSGCASLERTPAPPSPAPASSTASTTPPAPAVEAKAKAATPAPRTVAPKTVAAAPAPKAVEPKAPAEPPKSEGAAAKPSTEPPTTPAPAPKAKKEAAAPPAAAKPAAPALDLKGLETRLRETKAVGLMTKLALKNQVDDLLDEFRAFYQGKKKTTLRELRHSYDLLMLKVLALLQDADPSLAKAITNSREAIWGILADPTKFASV